ncbi:MAG TPA: hypothetical protein VGU70_22055 [Methylobacterium sp.]|jgi:hypothetical protein|uniref:hypothetical protein n=1 Tax=Methylorubrum sp. B1-46 TaxID=2897334 RepID=UPI001E5C6601|nr:hypothetical protein [Methylorubrum sp. B1-46]UGB23831.1 hypothetical protein LPC10_12605 [Methylorubrum sp. B1-46]HEV2545436.1 hypothetical protein [Methylobacterium sp.]
MRQAGKRCIGGARIPAAFRIKLGGRSGFAKWIKDVARDESNERASIYCGIGRNHCIRPLGRMRHLSDRRLLTCACTRANANIADEAA